MKLDAPEATTEALLHRLLHHPLPEIELSLERLRRFMERIGNPHMRLPPVVHVAGTNGKGSLVAFLRAMLEAGGYRCHVYTSPHLVRFHERIVVAGEEIADAALRDVLADVAAASAAFPITFFEAATAAGFLAFSRHQADIVLLEVGMGGRLDATNIIGRPELTAITPVSFDHMEFLGDRLAQIAYEKAGIIKEGVPCVVGPQAPEALEMLKTVGLQCRAPLFIYGEEYTVEGEAYRSASLTLEHLRPSLPGEFQYRNAATALACMERLHARFPVSVEAMAQGIAAAHWPARLQRLQGGVWNRLLGEGARELWLDGGHNPSAGEALADWLRHKGARVHLVMGMLADKDAQGYLAPLVPYLASLTVVEIPQEPKTARLDALLRIAETLGVEARAAVSPEAALAAIAPAGDTHATLIGGSLYLAGYVLAKNQPVVS